MQSTFRYRDRHVTVELQRREKDRFRAAVDGVEHEVQAEMIGCSAIHIVVDGRAHTARIARVGQVYHVSIAGEVYVLTPETGGATATHAGTLASPHVIAPMPGKVLQVLVQEGQKVAEGDGLLILEAMKMENRIAAEAVAVVRKVHVVDGQMVDGGLVMLELEYEES